MRKIIFAFFLLLSSMAISPARELPLEDYAGALRKLKLEPPAPAEDETQPSPRDGRRERADQRRESLEPAQRSSPRRMSDTLRFRRRPESVDQPDEIIDVKFIRDLPAIEPEPEVRVERRVRFPQHELDHRNPLSVIPVPNNLQLYPFSFHLPMEGGDLLRFKETEIAYTNTYVSGQMRDAHGLYQVDIDQWFVEQNFRFRLGLPAESTLQFAIPLYHFRGRASFQQAGVELIGLGSRPRNFWGGPSLSLKKALFENKEHHLKTLLSGWFEFPEGNQRARGGTSSGHYALNLITEKYWGSWRGDLNLGFVEAGELRLLNDAKLRQEREFFAGMAFSRAISQVLSGEIQLHGSRSALEYTGLKSLREWSLYGSAGLRGHYHGLDGSLSLIAGEGSFPEIGSTADLCFRF